MPSSDQEQLYVHLSHQNRNKVYVYLKVIEYTHTRICMS